MTLSLNRRVPLREVMQQAWQEIEGQTRGMLKRAVEGLPVAERDRRIAEARERGEKVYRWGYTVRRCWQTLWGAVEQVRVPRLRGQQEIGLLGKYEANPMTGKEMKWRARSPPRRGTSDPLLGSQIVKSDSVSRHKNLLELGQTP